MTPRNMDHYASVVDKAAGDLTRAAVSAMEQRLPWFASLSAQHRSQISLIAHAGITQCAAYLRTGRTPDDIGSSVFGAAPRELTRHVTLHQTVTMIRTTLDVLEEHVNKLFTEEERDEVSRGVLAFSREVAFATADVYARAAETRGQWDARMESLVIDAVVRGETEEVIRSRAAALGWDATGSVAVVVGSSPSGAGSDGDIESIRRVLRTVGLTSMGALQLERLVLVLGDVTDLNTASAAVADVFGDGPVVIGPVVATIAQAHQSARAALAGLRAARAWVFAPRPVTADALLVERALAGDGHARRALVERAHASLLATDTALHSTLSTFLETGGSVEAAARLLYVHPNTVRYRLRKIRDLTGFDPLNQRGAYSLRVGLTLGGLLTPLPSIRTERASPGDPGSL